MKNKKIIFWNVDTQKDFMNSDGALYVKGAEIIKPNLKKLSEFANQNNIQVVNTKDYHHFGDEELSDNPDFVNTFPKHCIAGSTGEEFIDETNPDNYNGKNCSYLRYTIEDPSIQLDDRNIIINKNKFDIFEGSPHTNKFLDLINPDIVIVYGVATNVCVNCAVLGLTERGIEVVVVNDAIKGLPNIPFKPVYDNWDSLGVGMTTVHELESFLNSRENDKN